MQLREAGKERNLEKSIKKMPCHDSSSSSNSYSNMNEMNGFWSDSSIDISFDSIMYELLSDVLYIQSQSQSMQQMRSKGAMILLLRNPTKVSTDTYRFNIDSKSPPNHYFHESEIIYLCKSLC